MKTLSEERVSRLREAITLSRQRLVPFRNQRSSFIRAYVGKNYGDNGSQYKQIVNFMEQAVSGYTRHMVAQNPKVFTTTTDPKLMPAALALELAMNKLLDRMNFADQLRLAAKDAMFFAGIMKVAYDHNTGQTYADQIDPDDWVHDMTAKRWEHIQFCGNRYRLPLDYVKKSEHYAHTDDLSATESTTYDDEGIEKAEAISRGPAMLPGEYMEFIDLWDIYLPYEGIVVTLDDQSGGKPLRTVEWDGPEWGPYLMLGYGEVPAQIIPLSPAARLFDLHMLANALFRKLERQSLRQKQVTGYESQSDEDAERLNKANDADTIRIDRADGIKDIRSGGIDPQSLNFFLAVKQMYSWMGGNVDALFGLSPQSETLGQDRLLGQTANKFVQDMQDRLIAFTTKVVRSLAWYVWHDPSVQMTVMYDVPQTEVRIPIKFDMSRRQGSFEDYEIGVLPYSMQYQSPGERLNMIQTVVGQLAIPAMSMLTAQGKAVDFGALFDLISRYANLPELKQILVSVPAQAAAQGGGGGMSPNTSRTYNRVSRTAPSGAQQDQELARRITSPAMTQEATA